MRAMQVSFAVLIVVGLLWNPPMAAKDKDAPEFDMRKKLEYSKNILDGLVTEDFEKIRQNAESLSELGKHKWLENESSAYRTQNQVFWLTAGSLALAAKEKNLDGATLSYTQMTLSCVNCHKLIRSQ